MNKQGGPVQMLMRQKEMTVPIRTAQQKPEEAEGKLVTGVLFETERPAYEELYEAVRAEGNLEWRQSWLTQSRYPWVVRAARAWC